jgi:hypothetical protein
MCHVGAINKLQRPTLGYRIITIVPEGYTLLGNPQTLQWDHFYSKTHSTIQRAASPESISPLIKDLPPHRRCLRDLHPDSPNAL